MFSTELLYNQYKTWSCKKKKKKMKSIKRTDLKEPKDKKCPLTLD